MTIEVSQTLLSDGFEKAEIEREGKVRYRALAKATKAPGEDWWPVSMTRLSAKRNKERERERESRDDDDRP